MSKFHYARTGFVVVTMAFAFASSVPAQTTAEQTPPTRDSEKADLKHLEVHGYKPAANESNYPNDIQRAEKATYGSGTPGSVSPSNATTPSTPQ